MGQNNLVKILIIAVIIAAFVLLGWFLIAGKSGRTPAAQNNVPGKTGENDAASRSSANIPQVVENKVESAGEQKLSRDIPHYEQTEKIESYELRYPNSTQVQDVYRFYSSKTMDENLSYYTDWAGKNGWKVANTIKENSVYSLYLNGTKESLAVKISKDNGKVKVSIDLLNF